LTALQVLGYQTELISVLEAEEMEMKHLVVSLMALGVFAVQEPLRSAEPSGVRATITPAGQRKPAPAFRLANASNDAVSLSKFHGKVVLLDFWATECGGCKVEIPWFMEFERGYKSARFEVVGVSMDIPYEGLKDAKDAWKLVKPFVQTHQVNYPILMGDDAVRHQSAACHLPARQKGEYRRRVSRSRRQGRCRAEYWGSVKGALSGPERYPADQPASTGKIDPLTSPLDGPHR
jgi:thiol-disulfide isomerase/thioredoxin